MKAFLQSAAHVTPSARQMAWFDTEFYAFLHFGVNTFTGREWGDGTESPAIFNPERLDCAQWAETAQAAGVRFAPKQVLEMVYLEDMSQRDAAEVVGYSYGRVSQLISKAVKD